MEVKDLLAGGLVGIIAKELFNLFVSRLSHKRERDKVFYTSKLRSSEKLIGLYVSYYFQIRTIIEVFCTTRQMVADPDNFEIDEEVIMKVLSEASQKCLELDQKIQDEGAGAYLYVDLKNSWVDQDFKEIFDMGNIMGPKVEKFNQLLVSDESMEEFKTLQSEIIRDLDTVIANFNRFKTAVDGVIVQLKKQALP